MTVSDSNYTSSPSYHDWLADLGKYITKYQVLVKKSASLELSPDDDMKMLSCLTERSLESKWNINSPVTRDYINLSNKYWIHLRLTLTDYKADSYRTVWLHYTDSRSRSGPNICDCQIYPIIARHTLQLAQLIPTSPHDIRTRPANKLYTLFALF